MYCPGHVVVKENDRADIMFSKVIITSSLRLGSSEELCDFTCEHKAIDIAPSIAWRRDQQKEGALDSFP